MNEVTTKQLEPPVKLRTQPSIEPTATASYFTNSHAGAVIQRIQSGSNDPLQFQQDILMLQRTIGNRAVVQLLAQKQKQDNHNDSSAIHSAAAAGVQGSGGKLPHHDKIQASFGQHNINHVQAYTSDNAAKANKAIGAEAYATGNKVAFADNSPSLFTAAHEAAHIIQQQAGVQLKGGVSKAGDEYEQHADQVANTVVQGKSAEPLLNRYNKHIYSDNSSSAIQNCQLLQVQMRGITTKKYTAGTGTITYTPSPTDTKIYTTKGLVKEQEADMAHADQITPADYNTIGTRTNSTVRTTSRAAQEVLGGSWIAGHLLNHYLGGNGHDYENITGFTSATNNAHLHQLEDFAKKEVNVKKNPIEYYTMVTKRKTFKDKKTGKVIAEGLASELKGGYKIAGAPLFIDVTIPASFPPIDTTTIDDTTENDTPVSGTVKSGTAIKFTDVDYAKLNIHHILTQKLSLLLPYKSPLGKATVNDASEMEDDIETLMDTHEDKFTPMIEKSTGVEKMIPKITKILKGLKYPV